jgi:D-alanine--D-alanine ligase
MGNSKKTIGVVHGGLSHERQKSLHYGKQVSKILENLGMNVLEMHLHPNGSWTVNGNVENIEEALKKTDKVWNCLVGVDGERGIVEGLCEKCRVKMVGHSQLHSHLSGDKKNIQFSLAQHNIKSPHGKVIRKKDYSKEKVLEVFSQVPVPAIVKPNTGSSMMGVFVVNNFTELEHAVEHLISQNEDVLVEKLIKGIPVSCFVFEHNNLLHTNIKVDGKKENGDSLTRDEQMNIRNEALYIHNCMAYNHHAEYDFIVTPKGLVFIEVNTHPSLTSGYINSVFNSGVVNLSEYVEKKI